LSTASPWNGTLKSPLKPTLASECIEREQAFQICCGAAQLLNEGEFRNQQSARAIPIECQECVACIYSLLLFVTSSQFQNLSVEKGYRFQIAGASQLPKRLPRPGPTGHPDDPVHVQEERRL
jgi:hypothetical protein